MEEGDEEISSGEVDEEEGHPRSFVGQSFPGKLVEGEDVDADAKQEQDGESRHFNGIGIVVSGDV